MLKWLSARANSFPVTARTHHIPVEKFLAFNEDILDTDYPGQYYYYRETVDTSGYPAGIRVDAQYNEREVRPISNSIITCRRTCNLQIRGKDQ